MIKKNSGKATISNIVKKGQFTLDIPQPIMTMLEEHTEGYILFYLKGGQLCVCKDSETNEAKNLGLQIMSRNFLKTVVEESEEFQKAEVIAHMGGGF